MNKKLVILFVFAFLIRLVALDQSLWLDETTTANVARNFSFFDIITKFSPSDFHPPLFYLFMKVWTSIFGYSEVALRMPSVLFSLGAGWFVYLIAKVLENARHPLIHSASPLGSTQAIRESRVSSLFPALNHTIPFWAAAFFLFNPLIIYYSQEARMYMMVTFLLACASYYFTKIVKEKSSGKNILLFNLFTFLSFLTFYGSVFFIVTFYLFLLWKNKDRFWTSQNDGVKLLLTLIPGSILSVILLSPLLSIQLQHSREALQVVTNWSLVLGQVNAKNLVLFPLKFAAGRISFFPKILYYALGGAWTLITFFFVFKGSLKNRGIAFFFIIPVVIGLLFSFFSPLLQYFRFIYLIIPMSLLLAFGAKKEMFKYILLVGFIVWSLVYLLLPQFHREDWKKMVITTSMFNVDYDIYMTPSAMDPFKYYQNYQSRENIQNLASLKNIKPIKKRILVVPYAAEIYGINYQKDLEAYGYQRKNTLDFRGLSLEFWERNVGYARSF